MATAKPLKVTGTGLEQFGSGDTLPSDVFATINVPVIVGYTLPPVNITGSSNTFTVDLTQGNDFVVTTGANSTVALPTPVAGQQYTVTVVYTGNHTITWAVGGGGTLKWFENNVEPTQTKVNGKEDLNIFSCRVNGTIRGSNGGRNG